MNCFGTAGFDLCVEDLFGEQLRPFFDKLGLIGTDKTWGDDFYFLLLQLARPLTNGGTYGQQFLDDLRFRQTKVAGFPSPPTNLIAGNGSVQVTTDRGVLKLTYNALTGKFRACITVSQADATDRDLFLLDLLGALGRTLGQNVTVCLAGQPVSLGQAEKQLVDAIANRPERFPEPEPPAP